MKNLFEIYFDGGCGSRGYGSWEVCFYGFSKKRHRQDFGIAHKDGMTCNVAEYLSLIGALEWLQSVKDKQLYCLHIRGDSKLVLEQIAGRYKCQKAHLKPLLRRCLELLKDFGWYHVQWYRRRNSVERFGH